MRDFCTVFVVCFALLLTAVIADATTGCRLVAMLSNRCGEKNCENTEIFFSRFFPFYPEPVLVK